LQIAFLYNLFLVHKCIEAHFIHILQRLTHLWHFEISYGGWVDLNRKSWQGLNLIQSQTWVDLVLSILNV
jgi:hypothetical protein